MYVRYKKNIQENDLPRKRVRKASKIAGSGRQDLEIRCPERGRKPCYHSFSCHDFVLHLEIRCPERGRKPQHNPFLPSQNIQFGNKMPREGTETRVVGSLYIIYYINLEIRCPERGRKHTVAFAVVNVIVLVFGNKMPREGTETNSFV